MVPVMLRSRSAAASSSICERVADGISTVHAQDGSGRAATAGSAGTVTVIETASAREEGASQSKAGYVTPLTDVM